MSDNYLHNDIKEIMLTRPSLVLRWGNLIIIGLLVVLLGFTAWFQYPEFVTTDVTLAAAPPTAAGPGRLLALGTIGREQYAAVRPGQAVQLQVHELGDTRLTGRVLRVEPTARQQQHPVVITLAPLAGAALYPSFSGTARIMLRRQSLLAKFLAR